VLSSHVVCHFPKDTEAHIETRGHTEGIEGRITPIVRIAAEQARCLPRDVIGVHLLPRVWLATLPEPSRSQRGQFIQPAGIDGLYDVTARIDAVFMGE
jgi:hypothetical protein